MKSILPIQIETPTLNEQTFYMGNVKGTEPSEGMFCYNFKHWCFTQGLTKKALKTFKSLVNDILEYKLDQLLDNSEIWQLEGTWTSKLPHRFHALVIKNLQKAMNMDDWHMGSDLFMEDALYEILEESFAVSGDNMGWGEDRKQWVAVFKSLGWKDEDELFENGIPEDMWWDLDFQMLAPNKKAIKDYCDFLRKAY
jgi:hypothetical protein